MHRLNFVLVLLWYLLLGCNEPDIALEQVHTVTGAIPADSLGKTLIHEHVFLDWRTADQTDPEDWDNKKAFDVILPHLMEMKSVGVRSFLECTPAYLGRNPTLLQQLSEQTGLHILTNTGFYGFRKNRFIPTLFHTYSAQQMADIWINEFGQGIEGTGIKPGFIKISVDPDSVLSSFQTELVRAAGLTHLATGLTIVSHTGIDSTAKLQLDLLAELGVAPDAFVWTHAQNGSSKGHVQLAKMGCWISLDGIGWIEPQNGDSTALYKYVRFLENLKNAESLHRTLISHDAGWYEHARPFGETDPFEYRGYSNITTLLFPVLRTKGFNDSDFEQLLVSNPKEAYTLRIRPSS